MMRVGIIGCGRVVEEGHVPAYRELGVTVTALADPVERRREKIGDMLGVPSERRFADYKLLLGQSDVDVVDIAVPHFHHHKVLMDAAQCKKHILCEKPLTTSLRQADQVLDAVAGAGVQLCVAHNYLYQPSMQLVRKMVQQGAIGEPFLIRTEGLGGSHWDGAPEFNPEWRTQRAIAGFGCLLDNGYHDIYLARALLGEVKTVTAAVSTEREEHEVEDLALALLQHEFGTTSLQVSWAVSGGGQWVYEVYGSEGTLSLSRKSGKLMHYRGEWKELKAPPWEWGFKGLFSDFFSRLQRGEPSPVPGAEGRRNLEVILSAYEASRTGVRQTV